MESATLCRAARRICRPPPPAKSGAPSSKQATSVLRGHSRRAAQHLGALEAGDSYVLLVDVHVSSKAGDAELVGSGAHISEVHEFGVVLFPKGSEEPGEARRSRASGLGYRRSSADGCRGQEQTLSPLVRVVFPAVVKLNQSGHIHAPPRRDVDLCELPGSASLLQSERHGQSLRVPWGVGRSVDLRKPAGKHMLRSVACTLGQEPRQSSSSTVNVVPRGVVAALVLVVLEAHGLLCLGSRVQAGEVSAAKQEIGQCQHEAASTRRSQS